MPSLRPTLAAAVAATALALSACGGDEAASPLDAALGYLPGDAPLAVAVSTDLDSDQYRTLGELVQRFPGGEQLVEGLRSELEQEEDVSFEEDLKPLLGNPFVVGAPDAEAITGDQEQFIGAIQVQDGERLRELIEQEGSATEAGEVSGATVYELEDGDVAAVEGDVMVVADTRERLDAALEQRDSDDRLTEEAFQEALADVPDEAPLKVYGNMNEILATSPESQEAAESVEWVGALETFGVGVSVDDQGLLLDLDVSTNPEALSEEGVPIAPGTDDPPPVVAPDDRIGVGIRDPAHIVRFAELAAEQAGASEVAFAKSQLSEQLGIDLEEDVIAQFTGASSAAIGLDGAVAFRSELADPEAFEETLRTVAQRLPRAAVGLGAEGLRLTPAGNGGLYTLSAPGGDQMVLGVVGGLFVVADSPQAAAQLAAAAPESVPEAEGSVTTRADAQAVAEQAVAGLVPLLGGEAVTGFLEPLGDLTGWLEADTSGLRGRFRLAIEQ